MGGPWENYGNHDGPWSSYAENKPVGLLDRAANAINRAASSSGIVGTLLGDYTEPLRKGREAFADASAPYNAALAAARANPNLSTIGNAVAQGVVAIPGQTLSALQQGAAPLTGLVNIVTKPVARGVVAATDVAGLKSQKGVGGPADFHYEPMTSDEAVDSWNNALNAGLSGVEGVPTGPARPVPPRAPLPLRAQRVRALQDTGVQLTPGQIVGGLGQRLEDAVATTSNSVRNAKTRANEQLSNGIMNDALAPIGGHVDGAGREAVGSMHEQIGTALDNAFGNANFSYDNQLHADIGRSAGGLLPSSRAEAQQIATEFVNDASHNGGLSEAFANLTRMRQQATQRGDASLSEFIHNLQQSVLDNIERTGGNSQAVRDARDAFSRSVVPERAAAKIGSAEGVPDANQLFGAVRESDRTVRKNAFARGDAQYQGIAEAAKDVMGKTINSSGTAERASLTDPVKFTVLAARNLALRGIYNRGVIGLLNQISRLDSAQAVNQGLNSLRSLARIDPQAADALQKLTGTATVSNTSPPVLGSPLLPGMSAAARPPRKKKAK